MTNYSLIVQMPCRNICTYKVSPRYVVSCVPLDALIVQDSFQNGCSCITSLQCLFAFLVWVFVLVSQRCCKSACNTPCFFFNLYSYKLSWNGRDVQPINQECKWERFCKPLPTCNKPIEMEFGQTTSHMEKDDEDRNKGGKEHLVPENWWH